MVTILAAAGGAPGLPWKEAREAGRRSETVHALLKRDKESQPRGKMKVMRILIASLLALGLLSAAENKLGKPLTVKEQTPLATLLAHADEYAGKTVQVKGKIVEVCQMMGCWLDLTNDEGQKVRVKVDDGVIVFPKDSAGKVVIAEGKFTKSELTREQAIARAKEEAEEKGKKFDPASVKGPVTVYQIEGSGAVILSN